jgi:flavin-dependent thymidylate synthase
MTSADSSKDLQRYADASMYAAAPMKATEPTVHILWMTPDPLRAIAAACRMYEGIPTYNLEDISEEERWRYAEQVQRTHLKAPLEFVKFHFFVEGVDRAFTHQLVRQRTAVYAQESLRFAVKENLSEEVSVPPSVSERSELVGQYKEYMHGVQDFYNKLISDGVPAEDARGVLPHGVLTRLNYCTDLRNLADHAGNRLCTQAQFHWRQFFLSLVMAIGEYSPVAADLLALDLFKPVCYQMGKCPFQADFDRGCTIRSRVETHARHGTPSREWHDIRTEEWMGNPKAAWQ